MIGWESEVGEWWVVNIEGILVLVEVKGRIKKYSLDIIWGGYNREGEVLELGIGRRVISRR